MVPRYAAGVISTKYNGAEDVAQVAKNESKKRPPISMGRLVDKDVIIVPIQTPRQPKKMCHVRPYQSDIQMNRAPDI